MSRPSKEADRSLLLRIAAAILGPEMADEVLGDLYQEAPPASSRRSRLALSLRAVHLAIAIRAQRSPAPVEAAQTVGGDQHSQRAPKGSQTWAVIGQELIHAWLRLVRAPAYSALSLLTVAIGICGAVAILSVVNGVLLRPLNFDAPEELMAVFTTERDGNELRNPSSPADFLDWKRASGDIATLAAATYWAPGIGPIDNPDSSVEKIVGLRVTVGLLSMLGVEPILGRLFSPLSQEFSSTAEPALHDRTDTRSAVVSWHTWQNRLGGRSDVIGKEIMLDGTRHVVIGVMPKSFAFPPFWATDAELWAPLELGVDPTRGGRFLRVFARLASGASMSALGERLATVHQDISVEHPETHTGTGVAVERLKEPMVSGSRAPLLMLATGSLILLALMATNLAGLLFTKGIERRGMLATQLALGASRRRLTLGIMFESLILMIGGAIAGTALALVALKAFQSLAADSVPRLAGVVIEPSTWLISIATMALLGLAIGFFPGLRLVFESENRLAQGAARFPRAERSRRLIVAAEIALTTGLLLLAGFVGQSFQRLAGQDLGFEINHVTTLGLDVPDDRLDAAGSMVEGDQNIAPQLDHLIDELAALPAVSSVGAINHLPLAGDLWRGKMFAVGFSAPDDDVRTTLRVATPGYADVMALRLLAGRFFEPSDRSDSERVVVINRALAEALWPKRSREGTVVGSMIAQDNLDDDSPRAKVIGIIDNVKQSLLEEPAAPEIYFPFSQNPYSFARSATVVLRGNQGGVVDATVLMEFVTKAIPGVALGKPQSLQHIVAGDLSDERARTLVLLLFAAVASLLATTGLFGVLAFSAAQRRREFGLRLALGSPRPEVAWLILREGVAVAAGGLIVGAAAALALGSWLQTVLYETSLSEPAVWGGVLLTVTALAIAGSLIPAYRASRTDPTSALNRY